MRPPPEVLEHGTKYVRRDLAEAVAGTSWSAGFRFGVALITTNVMFALFVFWMAAP